MNMRKMILPKKTILKSLIYKQQLCHKWKNTGDCEAPQEIIELDESCGYEFHSTAYIYEEVDEEC